MDTSVTQVSQLTGGIQAGNFIDSAIDDQLFNFNSDDTPLMNIMLKAKRVKVDSPVVEHYMIDEPANSVTTIAAHTNNNQAQAMLQLDPADQNLIRPYSTLLVKGVAGYTPDGQTATPGRDLMLFVVAQDSNSGNPVVRAVNGRKNNPSDEVALVPPIPAGTTLVILANSLYETQKEVDPDLIVPQPTTIYLQKRGMNQVVSDYFESQKKRIPFSKAIIAEQAISNFKVRGNRTLWAGRAGLLKVNVDKMGLQHVYTTEGLRWQFRRELQHSGRWSVEQFIALAKMFFTGEDAPKSALLLAGKNMLEQIQCIDFTKHPEIQISAKTNSLGWAVTNIHTVFGDIEIKREPTLDRLGWSNSGALIGENRLVHYVYSAEHSFSDRVEGQEATRNGILIWDALALKGTCHIWIDGDGESATAGGSAEGTTTYLMWDEPTAPPTDGGVKTFYLLCDCPAIDASAKAGQIWTCTGSDTDSPSWQQLPLR